MGVPLIDLARRRRGRGIIWVNSSHNDRHYIREAERSARTMRRFMSDVSYVLVSDAAQDPLDPVFDAQAVVPFPVPPPIQEKLHYNGQMVAKQAAMRCMTWERNLYLGSDIAVMRPEVTGIFTLLDRFDLVVAHAPARILSRGENDRRLLSLPTCYPEMNCDLIAYRRSRAVGRFLAAWQLAYRTNAIDHFHDQGAFRYLLYHSKLRFYVLPPEYNYRGFDAPENVVVAQRREVIGEYAKQHEHIAAIYGAPP